MIKIILSLNKFLRFSELMKISHFTPLKLNAA